MDTDDLIQLAETALRKRMQWQATGRGVPEDADDVAVAALNIDTLLTYVAITEVRRIADCLEALTDERTASIQLKQATATIAAQQHEIEQMMIINREIGEDCERMEAENDKLRRRINELEAQPVGAA